MKKLLPYLKPYTKESIISPLFKLLEAGFDLMVPIIVKEMIDTGIRNADKPYIWMMCDVLAVFALVGLSCSLIAQYYAAKAAVGFSAGLRSALFAHMQGFSYTQTDQIGTSTLITRMTADVNQLQSGINLTLRLLLRSPIIVFGAMILAFTVDAKSAWIFAVVIPLLAVVVFGIMLTGVPLYKKVQQNLDRVTSITRENLNGVRVIRAFRKEREEEARFEDANAAHNHIQNHVGKISALMNPITLLLVNGGLIVLLLSGAIRVDQGNLTTGEVFALTNYMSQILVELVKFANTIITVNKALACADRIEVVLDTPNSTEVLSLPAVAGDAGTAVCFHNAELTYEGNAEPSVSHVELTVFPGETVGIIGSTGSGKTSVINLISRYYDATSGTVTVNGRDVRSYSPTELREKIAVVPQKAMLFRGTVRSNLLWGNENATDEELWMALERACAKEFVMKKEGGLDTPVEQNGRNFSGGQRQRLTIARALVRGAEILILDDASSALDYATDAALRRALRELPNHPTVFLISQRTASIRHADKILVLEDGEPVGIGTHDDLLKGCEVYREIHESQFRKGGAEA
ncbi:MAG: ABC transporter ATP-binding protein [Ruminococcaceae bacterium]|nr:ABC transporter ATP-binding protein [Oscillospiraceae bacterium]